MEGAMMALKIKGAEGEYGICCSLKILVLNLSTHFSIYPYLSTFLPTYLCTIYDYLSL